MLGAETLGEVEKDWILAYTTRKTVYYDIWNLFFISADKCSRYHK
jgi:hypothetical protein